MIIIGGCLVFIIWYILKSILVVLGVKEEYASPICEAVVDATMFFALVSGGPYMILLVLIYAVSLRNGVESMSPKNNAVYYEKRRRQEKIDNEYGIISWEDKR